MRGLAFAKAMLQCEGAEVTVGDDSTKVNSVLHNWEEDVLVPITNPEVSLLLKVACELTFQCLGPLVQPWCVPPRETAQYGYPPRCEALSGHPADRPRYA